MRSICLDVQLLGMMNRGGNIAARRQRRRWNHAINRSRGSGGLTWKLNSRDSVIAAIPACKKLRGRMVVRHVRGRWPCRRILGSIGRFASLKRAHGMTRCRDCHELAVALSRLFGRHESDAVTGQYLRSKRSPPSDRALAGCAHYGIT